MSNLATNRQNIFWDIDLNFTKNPLTDDITLKSGYEAVAQSLRNIILMKRLWSFKNNHFVDMLFENMDNNLRQALALDELRNDLLNNESRIDDVRFEVEVDKNNHKIIMTVFFTLKTYPNKVMQFPIFIRER